MNENIKNKIEEMREFCDWCEETQKQVEILDNTCKNWYEEFHKLRRKKEHLQNKVKNLIEYFKGEELIQYFRDTNDLDLANKLEDFISDLEKEVL